MAKLQSFSTPARHQDFPDDPDKQAQLDALWNAHVTGFTEQAILGNPWNATNASDQSSYYDPLETDVPDNTWARLVAWTASPNRIVQYLGTGQTPPNGYNYPQSDLWELMDTGSRTLPGGITQPLPSIPANLCPQADWAGPMRPFGPYGPRGWQDEYCEWSVTRNAAGKITRVDIVCENPEYWYTFWRVDPAAVAAAYETALNFDAPPGAEVSVAVEDLILRDPLTNEPVVDPATGRPAYNPLNRWNNGTTSIRDGSTNATGGAMHLTATPNTLQTEIGEGAAGTVQRTENGKNPAPDAQAFMCCGQFGQNYRHSDPLIGQTMNLVVAAGGGNIVSLADPVGLYIQPPDWTQFGLPSGLPAGAQASDCWDVVRGSETLVDPVTGQPFPGSFILHAVFRIPPSWLESNPELTVGDLTVGGASIEWAAQIIDTMKIALFPRPIPAPPVPPARPCVGTPETILCQPLQLFHESLWNAYAGTMVENPVGFPEVLASNTVIIPPEVTIGSTGVRMALTCSGALTGSGGELPSVSFPAPGGGTDDVHVEVIDLTAPVVYAVPGNSYPSPNQVLILEVTVDRGAEPGVRSVLVDNPGQGGGIPAPGFLNVVA